MLEVLDTYDWAEVFADGDREAIYGGFENPYDRSPVRLVGKNGPLEEVSTEPIRREDVEEILARSEGSQTGYSEWTGVLLGRLKDGRFILMSGWCDTSGWGCRDGVGRYVGPSVAALARWAADDEDRKVLNLSVDGVLA